jgi:hypothetical protein
VREVIAMLEWFAAAAAVSLVLFAVGAVALHRSLRRARRRWRVRLLEARGYVQPPGPRRDTARLRSRLNAELQATEQLFQQAPQGLIFRADAQAVLAEVTAAAGELDAELAAIARFIDPSQQRAALTTVGAQVEQLIEATYTARHTILRTAAEDRARQLDRLSEDIAAQATSADTYRRRGRELSL